MTYSFALWIIIATALDFGVSTHRRTQNSLPSRLRRRNTTHHFTIQSREAVYMHPDPPRWCASARPIRAQIYPCDWVMWSAALWGNSPVQAKIHVKQLYPPMNHTTADIKCYQNSTGSEEEKKHIRAYRDWCVFIKIFAVLHCLLVILHHYWSKFKSTIHSVLLYQPALLVSRLLSWHCDCNADVHR